MGRMWVHRRHCIWKGFRRPKVKTAWPGVWIGVDVNTIGLIWKHAIVIPILKARKDPRDPSSYRPISMTSAVCKLMEKLINNRLIWYLENRHLHNLGGQSFSFGGIVPCPSLAMGLIWSNIINTNGIVPSLDINDIIKTSSSAVAKRPHALCVVEYFARSLKVIRNDSDTLE